MTIRRNPRTSGDHYHEYASRQTSREYPDPRRQPDGPTLRELGALAAQYRVLMAKQTQDTNL